MTAFRTLDDADLAAKRVLVRVDLNVPMSSDRERFAAVVTFAIAASSLSLFGIGSAFWSLVAGLAVLTLDFAAGRLRSRS